MFGHNRLRQINRLSYLKWEKQIVESAEAMAKAYNYLVGLLNTL